MAEEGKKKKIVGLRTFADDVKRARGGAPVSSDIPRASLATPKKPGTDTQPPKPAVPTPPKKTPDAKKQKKGFFGFGKKKKEKVQPQAKPAAVKKTVTIQTPPPIPAPPVETQRPAEPPMDIPPFHNIRASSPGDTTFKNTKEVKEGSKTRSDKRTHQSHKKIKADTLGIDTNNFEEMSDSVLSSTRDAVFDTEEAMTDVGGGTIVTDRKREKFKVLPAVGEAVSEWVEDKVDDVEDAYRPKHEIVRSSRRKDIITAAAKDAKLAPGDDYSSLKEKLRQMERITETEDLQIKDEAEVPAPTWTHTDDPESTTSDDVSQKEQGPPTTTERDTEPSVIHAPEADVSHPEEAEKVPETELEPELDPRVPDTEVPETPLTDEPASVTREDIPVTPYEPEEPSFTPLEAPLPPSTPVPEPEVAPTLAPPEPEPAFVPQEPQIPEEAPALIPAETEQPAFVRAPVPTYRLDRAGQPIPNSSAGTPYLTLIAVVIAAVILGVGSTIWWFGGTSSPETVTVERPHTLVNAQSTVAVSLSTNRTEFYGALSSAAQTSNGQVISFTPSVGESGASTAAIMTTLAWNAPENFLRNISSLTFGFTSTRAPYIVMRTNTFDVAFGGILAWEPFMTRDLSPLFGAATEVNVYDTKISNHDIRILTSDGYNDKIVYGFIDKNSILITTNRDAFSEIAPLVIQ